jgi:TPR repeat protein
MEEKRLIQEIEKKIQNADAENTKFNTDDRARSLDFKTKEEAQEYLDNLFTEFSFQCYGEKRADGCYRLANYHENISLKYDEAAKIHKYACDKYDYPRSCYHYSNAAMLGRGLKKDSVESFKYNLKSCNLNVGQSCLRSGIMAYYGKEVTQNRELGVKCLEKACDLKEPDACLQLFQLYFNEGLNDPPKALEYSKRACNLGNFAGCVNAHLMYKRGDGVNKDEEKAKIYRQKGEEILELLKPQQGIVFGEGHKGYKL